MTAAGESPDPDDLEQIIITVHGIRTFGQWQERLGSLLVNAGSQAEILHYKYGYFSSIAFLFPIARYLQVLAFAKYLMKVPDAHPRARIDLVSHSFGTHVVAWAIRKLSRRQSFSVGSVILSGSVLRPTFPWNELLMQGAVADVVNECGTKDWVLVINQLISPFTGMAGRVGFIGLLGQTFVNNFFAFGHSGYFMERSLPTDDFMRTRWVPLLTNGTFPSTVDERRPGGPFGGIVTWLLQNSEPIKLSMYSAPFILTSILGFHLYIRTLSSRLAAESMNERANFPELSLLLSVESSALNESNESNGALIGALQRTLPVNHFFWGESSVLMMTPLGGLMDIAFSHSGAVVAIGDYSGCVNVYDVRTGVRSEHFCLEPETFVGSLTFDRDDSKIAIFGGSGLYVWSRKARRFEVAAVPIDGEDVRELALSPNGKVLVTVSDASVATFWTLDPKVEELNTLALPFAAASVTFSPDNHHFAIGGTEGQISIWDLEHGPHQVKMWKSHDGDVEAAFNHDGSILATAGDSGDLEMWDTATFKQASAPIKIRCCANRIEFSKDGELLAISLIGPRALQVLDVASRSFRQIDTAGFAYPFAWSPQGHELVSAGGHGTAAILDIERSVTMARVVQEPSSVPPPPKP